MKKIILFATIAITIISCGNNNEADHSEHNAVESQQPAANSEPEKIISVKPMFTSLNNNVAAHINDIFQHYIHVKTALVNSDSKEAQNGAGAIVSALKNFDRSLLPASQKAGYDKNISAIKTAAENIAGSSDIEKQREHFASLSDQAYELAKTFGAGKTVYHQHCPMALNDKGAMWLSEGREVKNPYYGEKMMGCGTVEEVIEQ